MSTAAPSDSTLVTSPPLSLRAARAWTIALSSALVLNVLALGIGAAAGADLLVTPPGALAATAVGIGSVVLVTAISTALGLVALVVTRRWGARCWRATAWLGLALGVLTTGMPFSVEASSGTRLTLASMHVLTGLAWFLAVRRSLASNDEAS